MTSSNPPQPTPFSSLSPRPPPLSFNVNPHFGVIPVSRFLLRQAFYLPLAAMLVPVVASWFVPGYSSVSQHMSELELLGGTVAVITRAAAIVSGASIILFALGLLGYSRRYVFTAFASVVFGLSMISNGIFVMGSPLHGLYGIGLISILGPAFFVAESQGMGMEPRTSIWFLAASLLTLFYMWLLLVGLDPLQYHGLTQRLSVIIIFGWYSLASLVLLSRQPSAQQQPG